MTSSMRAVGLAVFGSWVAVAGCMVDGSRSVVDPTLAGERGVLIGVAEVGPAGGKFVGKDVGISLSIPPGALEESTTIEIRQLELESVPDGVVADTVFELGPDGTRFKRPVELALRFSDDARVDRESSWLRVVQILPDGTLGRTQFVTYEPEARQVTAKLMHFSSYAVADLNAGEAAFESSEERVDQVDLLVLVDDSRSMVGEQENLARNFPRLAAKLNDAGLDYRVGIISPNLGVGEYTFVDTCETPGGLQGKLQADPQLDGCVPPTDPWIAANGEQTNVPGDDVAAAFSCIAKLGSHGCGFEQTLEAVYRALDPAVNPGFIRNDAALAVLLITDEDDCSARDTRLYDTTDFSLGPANFRCFEYGVQCDGFTADNARDVGPRSGCRPREDGLLHPISRYVERLRQLKPEGKVVVSLAAGPTGSAAVVEKQGVGAAGGPGPDIVPSCRSGEGGAGNEAFPAIRLRAFAEAFGPERSSFTSICEPDFSPALDQLGDLVVQTHKLSWCLPYDPEDTNPDTPALDADCVVDAGNLGVVPACDEDTETVCYAVSKNADCANSTSQLELLNARPEDPGQDAVKVTCLVP